MGFCGSSLCSGSGLPESEIYDGLTLTIENWTWLPHKKVLFLTNLKRENDFVEVPDAVASPESGIYGGLGSGGQWKLAAVISGIFYKFLVHFFLYY